MGKHLAHAEQCTLSSGAVFGQYIVERPGMTNFFLESATEERGHAIQMIDYLNMRGINYNESYTFGNDAAAKECIGECPRSRRGFVSTETLEKIEESRAARLAGNRDQHRALSRRTRTLLRRDKERLRRSWSCLLYRDFGSKNPSSAAYGRCFLLRCRGEHDLDARWLYQMLNIIHPPLLLSIVKRLISQVCRFTWDTSLGDALRAPTMGWRKCRRRIPPEILRRDQLRWLQYQRKRHIRAENELEKITILRPPAPHRDGMFRHRSCHIRTGVSSFTLKLSVVLSHKLQTALSRLTDTELKCQKHLCLDWSRAAPER
ncbi:hypothetical protein GWK47_047875 [Chionoecetes opilio]|uniref:Ferritin n=1 Tax=Chionoecetes opilio TaxID=41210 RepID=A0A8J5CSI7_CHIOP|nr:hypothetical protein GWK47_047875 [Chionoecetes opilio]